MLLQYVVVSVFIWLLGIQGWMYSLLFWVVTNWLLTFYCHIHNIIKMKTILTFMRVWST